MKHQTILRIIVACMNIHDKIGGGWPSSVYRELLQEAMSSNDINWEKIPVEDTPLSFVRDVQAYWCNNNVLLLVTHRHLWTPQQQVLVRDQLVDAEIDYGLLVNLGFRDLFLRRIREGKLM